jgi:hypothetical protein
MGNSGDEDHAVSLWWRYTFLYLTL